MIFTLSEDMTASGALARDLTNTMWSLRCGRTWQQADLPPKVCIVHGGGCFADQSLFIAWGVGGEEIGAEGDQSSPMRTGERNHKNIVLQSFMGGIRWNFIVIQAKSSAPTAPLPLPYRFSLKSRKTKTKVITKAKIRRKVNITTNHWSFTVKTS